MSPLNPDNFFFLSNFNLVPNPNTAYTSTGAMSEELEHMVDGQPGKYLD